MDEHLRNRESGFGGREVQALRRDPDQSDEETDYLTGDLQVAGVGKGSFESRKPEKFTPPAIEEPKSPTMRGLVRDGDQTPTLNPRIPEKCGTIGTIQTGGHE